MNVHVILYFDFLISGRDSILLSRKLDVALKKLNLKKIIWLTNLRDESTKFQYLMRKLWKFILINLLRVMCVHVISTSIMYVQVISYPLALWNNTHVSESMLAEKNSGFSK